MKTTMHWQQASISQDAVEQAMDRCDRMGRDAFRKDTHTGFKAAKGKRVMLLGRGPYEPRPLVAAAYAISYPERPRLGPKDFAGDTARQHLLRHHGFTLEGDEPPVRHRSVTYGEDETIVIGGTRYSLSHASVAARKSLEGLKNIEKNIKRLQSRLSIHQTARSAYEQELFEELR